MNQLNAYLADNSIQGLNLLDQMPWNAAVWRTLITLVDPDRLSVVATELFLYRGYLLFWIVENPFNYPESIKDHGSSMILNNKKVFGITKHFYLELIKKKYIFVPAYPCLHVLSNACVSTQIRNHIYTNNKKSKTYLNSWFVCF